MTEKLTYRHVSYRGAGRLEVDNLVLKGVRPIERGKYTSIVSVLDIHKLFRTVSTDDAPHWWVELTQQSKQVERSKSPFIMRLPDNSYLVTGRYVESFYQWLSKLDSDGVFYDRQLNAVIIDNPTWGSDLSQAMTYSGVQSTSVAAGYISPETKQSKKLKEDAAIATKEGFDLPSRVYFPTSRRLMKHQEDVVKVLAWRGHGIIADDVGSGKSSMFLGGFFSLVQHRVEHQGESFSECFPLVVVTKKSLVEPIARESQAWFNSVKVHVVGMKKKNISKGQPNAPMKDAHVIVCSLSVIDKHIDSILACNPQGVVFDESHMIKNTSAKRTQAALELSSSIKSDAEMPYVVCVSATPMPNRPQELWAQLLVTGMDKNVIEVANRRQKPSFPKNVRGSLRSFYTLPVDNQKKFEIRYCKGRPGPFGWEAKGSENESELREILYDSGFIRRKKSEFITPLPPLRQAFVNCTLNEDDEYRYQVAEKEFLNYAIAEVRKRAKADKWSRAELFEAIQDKAMKTQTSEAIMKMTAIRQLVGEAKIDSCVEWIHKYFRGDPRVVKNGHNEKLIVFAHHKSVQDKLINHPELQQYGVLSIQAGQKNVNDIVDEFQDPTSGKKLIICYSEAREGLTLTAAYAVLVVEIPWSPSWLLQMAGRCWSRFSELYPPHEATIYYAVSNTHIDNYLIDMVRAKGWLNKTIIDPEVIIEEVNESDTE